MGPPSHPVCSLIDVFSPQIFIKDNQTSAEKTRINYLGFVGVLARAANMKEFKRVSSAERVSNTKRSCCIVV